MSFYPGKNSSWTYSSVARPFDRISMSFAAEVIDTTNFTSGGYQTNAAGVMSCQASAEGPYNGTLGLSPGDSLAHVFNTGGGGPSFTVTFRVAEIRLDTATRNAVARASLSLVSNGSFTVTF